MNDLIIYNDNFSLTPDLSVYLLEMNVNLNYVSEKKRLYNLFGYLVDRGYHQPAADLVDYMLRKKIITKPV